MTPRWSSSSSWVILPLLGPFIPKSSNFEHCPVVQVTIEVSTVTGSYQTMYMCSSLANQKPHSPIFHRDRASGAFLVSKSMIDSAGGFTFVVVLVVHLASADSLMYYAYHLVNYEKISCNVTRSILKPEPIQQVQKDSGCPNGLPVTSTWNLLYFKFDVLLFLSLCADYGNFRGQPSRKP